MHSIVICSRNSDISVELKQNIADTIGCDYELVVIDNSRNQYNIFHAYNEGMQSAKGDILCFVHDDVRFRTNGWASKVERHFEEDEELGLIGFAGAHFLPDAPMYWDESPFVSEHNLTTRKGQTEQCFSLEHFGGKTLAEVAVADGMCLFVRKSLFDRIAFDEATYQGFHLYDMDISMQVREAGYKVCVCNDILVEHFYEFSPNKSGYALFGENLKKFHHKWASHFPLSVGLEGMTEGMTAQLNTFVKQKIQLEDSLRKVRESKAYRVGKTLLHPMKKLKG